tara:strand:- start:1986 stop:3938 length:1953 start_codon:yes stop_codon:yes gene_type:complete
MEERDLEEKLEHRAEPKSVKFKIDEEARTVEFPFSSEMPVDRGYLGNEVLDHREESVDLSRLKDAGPLLFNHDRDKPIGVVEDAYLKNKRGYVKVRFSDNPFPSEVFNDVKSGILRGVSTGYAVNKTVEETSEDGDSNQYRVVAWQPLEVSICSLAADPSVGVGRSANTTQQKETSNISKEQREDAVTATPVAPPKPKPPVKTVDMSATPESIEVVRAETEKSVLSKERARVASIRELCATHKLPELAKQAEDSGMSIEETRAKALDAISKKPVETVSPVELDQKQQERYSLVSGIRAALTGDWSEAGYVRELSQEVERSGLKRSAERSFFVPFTALTKRATYVTSGATTGGNLVATDLYDQDFIEALRNQSKMMSLGVKALPGLVGDVAIPRRSGVSSTYYLSSETTAITQSESTFDQVTMTPKNLAALSKYSRQTLLTATPGIEALIRTDLTDGLNTAVDLGILNGAGSSGAPTGIMQTSGIGSVAIGTNGGAVTIEALVDLEEQILIDNGNVSDNMAYVTNAKVLAELKKLRAGGSASGDGSFLWNTDPASIGRGGTPGSVNGYPLAVTNQVPSNLTKGSSSGVCSAILMGDFSQCSVGFWGSGLEITVGEESDDFAKALTSIRGIITYDVAVRHAESFAACLDITT